MLIKTPKMGGRLSAQGADTATSGMTAVTPHATNTHTKGSWVQIGVVPSWVTRGFYLALHANTAHLVLADIGVSYDGGSTYTPILNNLIATVDGSAAHLNRSPIWVPLRLGFGGARIGCRCQASNTTATMQAGVTFVERRPGEHPGFAVATTYGPNTGTSRGLALDSGATSHTLPANYVQITASLTAPCRHMTLQVASLNGNPSASAGWLLTLARGAAASEVPIGATLFGNTNNLVIPRSFDIPISLPAGTRIAAKHQAGHNTDNLPPRDLDVALVCYE